MLAAKGLTGADARRFLEAPLSMLHDPFLLPDMDKAVPIIEEALTARQKIAVYGDYDADGVTACALLTDYLRSRGADCVCHIPRRDREGYGLHAETLKSLYDAGVSLVITVDVGVTATEAAKAAKDMGLRLVITDHHDCLGARPPAEAVIDPKLPGSGSDYPFEGLAGVGVAFKLACALEMSASGGRARGGHIECAARILERYGDLAALGTVADVMPMTDENRVLARRGLELLSQGGRVGLDAITNRSGAGRQPPTESAVSFCFAPILNAAGRMGDALTSVELLLTDDAVKAENLADLLIGMNNRRREIEADIYGQVVSEWESSADSAGAPALIMAGRGWHQGVTGIVCSKLVEKYRKPVFLIALGENDEGKGSARAPKPYGVSLTELLSGCGHTLITFGGHASAAGFSIDPANVNAFRDAVFTALRQAAPLQAGAGALVIDAAAQPDELTMQTAADLRTVGPFGPRNAEPVLMLADAAVERVTPLKGGRHVSLTLASGGKRFKAIGFGFRDFPFRAGDRVDAAFSLSVNLFRGEKNLQLELRDVRLSEKTSNQYKIENELYERFINNENDCGGDFLRVASLGREDLAAVWRYLEKAADELCRVKAFSHSLIAGAAALNPRIGMARLRASLDIFSELGLLTYAVDGDVFCVTLHGRGKVELSGSKLFRELTTNS